MMEIKDVANKNDEVYIQAKIVEELDLIVSDYAENRPIEEWKHNLWPSIEEELKFILNSIDKGITRICS